MAMKKLDDKKAQGARGIFNRYLGQGEDGKSFARNSMDGFLDTWTFGHHSSTAPGKSRAAGFHAALTVPVIGMIFYSSVAAMLPTPDTTVLNDNNFTAETASTLRQTDGYSILKTGDKTAIMMSKNAQGDYEIYKGSAVNNDDWRFTLLENTPETENILMDVALEFMKPNAFPDAFEPNEIMPYEIAVFDRISAPLSDPKNGTYRVGDELMKTLPIPINSLTSTDLESVWMEAARAATDGKIKNEVSAEPLTNDIFEDSDPLPGALLDKLLSIYALIGALSIARAGTRGVGQSNRRFRKEFGAPKR